jgi:hypothetical protein
MKPLENFSSTDLADQLEDLDQAIENDQGVVASARRRIRNNSRLREQILSMLTMRTSQKGWR